MIDILKLVNKVKKTYDHLCLSVMKKYDLTRSELDILLFLYNNPENDSAKDIVEKRGLVKSHVSMGIESLIKKGLLMSQRDEQDKRKYHLYVLDQAKPIIHDGLIIQKQFGDMIFYDISEEETEIFKNILLKMYTNLEVEK